MCLTLISKNRTIIKHASLPQLRGKVRLVDRLLQSIIHFSTGSFSFHFFHSYFFFFLFLLVSRSIYTFSFLFISLFITTPCSQLYRACLQSCENSVLSDIVMRRYHARSCATHDDVLVDFSRVNRLAWMHASKVLHSFFRFQKFSSNVILFPFLKGYFLSKKIYKRKKY